MKICCRCDEPKELTEFTPRYKGGVVVGIRGHCKECQRHAVTRSASAPSARVRFKVKRADRWAYKAAKIDEYFAAHPCVDCGESDRVVLEFDHVRGEKLFNISMAVRDAAWSKLIAEIEKCDVRCVNCHLRRSEQMRSATTKPHVLRTDALLMEYLDNHPCVDCREHDPIVLQFDHVRGDKIANITRLRDHKWETIEAEIAKCEVRCGNCHRRATAKRTVVHS